MARANGIKKKLHVPKPDPPQRKVLAKVLVKHRKLSDPGAGPVEGPQDTSSVPSTSGSESRSEGEILDAIDQALSEVGQEVEEHVLQSCASK
jgi:hypothetical protein